MWYITLLFHMYVITLFCSIFLPWSIMVESYQLNGQCELNKGFHIKLWGSACGVKWEDYDKSLHNMYFALVDVIQQVRIMNLVVMSTTVLLFCYHFYKKINIQTFLMVSLVNAVIIIVSLSDYINDMQSTMTIPVDKIFIQGPGYMMYMLSASIAGAIFFIHFYIFFYKIKFDCDDDIFIVKYGALMTIVSSMSAFSNLMKVKNCSDYVSSIDLYTCEMFNDVTFQWVGIMVFLSALLLYMSLNFIENKIVNNVINVINMGFEIYLIVITIMSEHFENGRVAFYSLMVGILLNVVFILVYNKLLIIPTCTKQ